MFLKPCATQKTIEGESSNSEEASEAMLVCSPVVVNPSYLTKRKAEFEPELEEEEEEESDGEVEECRYYKPEPKIDMLKAPEWDVDSFDGLEYYSSPELPSSSDDDVEAMEHTRIYKRQIIESKGFYADPELRPGMRYRRIYTVGLNSLAEPSTGKTYGQYWEEIVHICLEKYNQGRDPKVELVEVVRGNRSASPRTKSYVTFMAREKPNGPLVEYQAKGLLTFDGIVHPIFCRPAPTLKPSNQNY